MLIMQISTQTGNYEYSKKVTNKRVHFLKNGSEVLKPYIQHFMQNSINFSYKMQTLWSSEVNKPILEQVKVVE